MDWQKTLNLVAIGVVAWLLLIQWDQFDGAETAMQAANSSEQVITVSGELPAVEINTLADELPSVASEIPASTGSSDKVSDNRLVTVTTDVFEVSIDTLGGDIVQVRLLNHLTAMPEDGGVPFELLTRSNSNQYVAQSGLIGKNGTDTAKGRPLFAVATNSYQLTNGDQQLNVDLTLNQDGVKIVKRFQFKPSDYTIGVQYLINNLSYEPWQGTFYGQIKRDSHEPLVESSGGIAPYLGAALRETEKNYAKYDFSDMADESVKTSIQGGWVAMVQHYFVSAWVPPRDDKNAFSLRKLSGQDVYLMGFTGKNLNIPAGGFGEYQAQFYVGPKDQKTLSELAEYLDLTVDYGFLWMVAKPIFAAMKWIYAVVGNWGWAIILLTFVIKVLLYPLSATSLRSMAKMRNLQPEMTRLKELYGDDRQKMSQELMGLYKKEKVNPAGGCFPMLLQMPVFLALYWVLLESVEIRHMPWIFWIQDLSAKDPYFILPLVMGASMLLMQKMQPMPTDPMQAKVMQLMPIMFTFFFMIFPAGLVLYWTINNLLSMLQQWYVNNQLKTAKKN
ncbi:MAG: membrane protein insertase YidC [Porticoccaceae bacterium]|jgi:YidC/Oxa1 family membrane protein insertase|nr:membrane protein insertase YidC [Porticoccaceae bacterium]MBT5577892.1 membrane protein insertase YidC [Porticoccaceae bacterium]MBT7375142.1 membrane protein insertase YidC [Porticoccaceae bacterium]